MYPFHMLHRFMLSMILCVSYFNVSSASLHILKLILPLAVCMMPFYEKSHITRCLFRKVSIFSWWLFSIIPYWECFHFEKFCCSNISLFGFCLLLHHTVLEPWSRLNSWFLVCYLWQVSLIIVLEVMLSISISNDSMVGKWGWQPRDSCQGIITIWGILFAPSL